MRADLAQLLQNRQSRLQVNLQATEAAAVAAMAAKAGTSRSSIARALLINGLQQLQAA